ncbi:Putative esterase [Ruminococcus sp. YE71]|uniref:alpha/beta hydrolase n=1 Tax=unclassified Ruminococcus TaxID=2608920 RepID=UPI00088BA9CC|nr:MULTISPECIES: alpha/beta hydrolase-fold protein [unclassified Ruminococcus]SDA28284.1 Putative esterase [Ruminococcus sp. YE78]SFW34705.1 Putative esterase [Ruminococcus sp. YE71]
MKIENLTCGVRSCTVHADTAPEYLLIQPADRRELELLGKETAHIRSLTDAPFVFAAFEITDWNSELSPWEAPPVFENEPFGSGAGETLAFIEDTLIPKLTETYSPNKDIPVILGGYSLAGLFALWAAYSSERFDAVAAVSPSVWFSGWSDFIGSRSPAAKSIYLSLGKKEEKTRNKTMVAVGGNIRRQYKMLKTQGIGTVLEWNEGNHFTEPEIRTAKGFAWCISAAH